MTDPSAAKAADRQLMIRLAAGDEGALEDILERHWASLLDYATKWLHAADIAQDMVQEAFIRLWDRRARWEPNGGPRPILFRIVRNLAIDHRRQAAIHGRYLASLPRTPWVPADATSVEEAELATAIDRALDTLNTREREIVVLSRIHGLTRAEICQVTGLAPGTVSNLLSIGMARLWRIVEPLFLDTPSAGHTARSHLRKI